MARGKHGRSADSRRSAETEALETAWRARWDEREREQRAEVDRLRADLAAARSDVTAAARALSAEAVATARQEVDALTRERAHDLEQLRQRIVTAVRDASTRGQLRATAVGWNALADALACKVPDVYQIPGEERTRELRRAQGRRRMGGAIAQGKTPGFGDGARARGVLFSPLDAVSDRPGFDPPDDSAFLP